MDIQQALNGITTMKDLLKDNAQSSFLTDAELQKAHYVMNQFLKILEIKV
jgi:hypothetical protein